MTPQAVIKARLLELAGAVEVRVTVTRRQDAWYVNIGPADYTRSIKLLHKLFPEAYLTSGGAFDQTFRLAPDGAIAAVLGGVDIDPAWLSWNDATVVKLARGIAASRDFHRLPILADALEEAGCANALLLDHCRAGAAHGRTCWLVDLILGAARTQGKNKK